MQGTLIPINKALYRPLLIAGVEKRLVVVNALLSFLITAATHFYLPQALSGIFVFIGFHFLGRVLSQHDPFLTVVFKRSMRFCTRGYFPALSHPLQLECFSINSI